MDLPGAKLKPLVPARFRFSRIKRLPTNPLYKTAPVRVHACVCVRVCFLAVPPFLPIPHSVLVRHPLKQIGGNKMLKLSKTVGNKQESI